MKTRPMPKNGCYRALLLYSLLTATRDTKKSERPGLQLKDCTLSFVITVRLLSVLPLQVQFSIVYEAFSTHYFIRDVSE